MKKPKDPRELVVGLLKRSTCKVQVAAALSDKHGIFAWGVNHAGDGYGLCAERETLRKCNYKRVSGAVLWIAARRKKSGNPVCSKPCAVCWPVVKQCLYVVYREKTGEWTVLRPNEEQ